jgi:Carboxypeptidase regulatory-like domain
MNRPSFVGAVPALMCAIDTYANGAQVSGGSISGVVTDEQGAALPGVTLSATASPVTRIVSTDADGSYRVGGLPPGEYLITSERSGFAKLVRENVVVREGLNLALDLTMTLGGVSEVVDVKTDTPMLESKTAVKAVNIGGDLQRARYPCRRSERGLARSPWYPAWPQPSQRLNLITCTEPSSPPVSP